MTIPGPFSGDLEEISPAASSSANLRFLWEPRVAVLLKELQGLSVFRMVPDSYYVYSIKYLNHVGSYSGPHSTATAVDMRYLPQESLLQVVSSVPCNSYLGFLDRVLPKLLLDCWELSQFGRLRSLFFWVCFSIFF